MKQALTRMLVVAVFFALLFSAVLPTTAFAQEGQPPIEPTGEPLPQPEPTTAPEASSPTEGAEDDLVELSEEEPQQEAAAEQQTEEVPSAEGAEEQTSSLLADLPEGTDLVVLDENGEPMSLASDEAAQAIVIGDPMWCPTGVTPPVGGGGVCSPSFTVLQDLFDWLTLNDPNVNGTIWIEKNYNDTTDAFLDGTILINLPTKTLVIQGGWDGPGTRTIDINSPSEINHKVIIQGWQNDITLNDVLITEATGLGFALSITDTTGKITLTRVEVSNNETEAGGAIINNSTGVKDIVITSATFSNNDGLGLTLNSKGLISVRDITAIGNGSYGVNLYNSFVGVTKGITLSGNNVFAGNGGNGLSVASRGPISASNLIAVSNADIGAQISNQNAVTAQPVTLTGFNEFKYNDDGLLIMSKGVVTVSNITAVNNTTWWGAYIQNDASTTGAGVTLTGSNTFNNNGYEGLFVQSNGVISISNLTANNNGFYGAKLWNYTGVSKAVTLTGTTTTIGNSNSGLYVVSMGSITVSNLTASNNGGDGALLENQTADKPQAVNVLGFALFENNATNGLVVQSKGAITVRNAAARGNTGFGMNLVNNVAGGNGSVTVQALVEHAGGGNRAFAGNAQTGLQILSNGAVSIIGPATFVSNGKGLHVDNTGGQGNVTLSPAPAGTCYGATENGGVGIEILTNGVVNLGAICAYDNLGSGVVIDNSSASAPRAVTVAPSSFTGNAGSGLAITSAGAVTLGGISAYSNADYGVFVDNSLSAGPQPVRLNGLNTFHSNGNTGLNILSKGSITANNMDAWNNGHASETAGIWLNNKAAPASTQAVVLTGFVNVSDSWSDGLVVESYGAITVNNIWANHNGYGAADDQDKVGHGAKLLNGFDDTVKTVSVTLNGTNTLDNNWSGGLLVESRDAIKVNNLAASNNNGDADAYGARLDNCDWDEINDNTCFAAAKPISLTGYGHFENNAADGLSIHSRGVVTMANLTAIGNGGSGVLADNMGAWGLLPGNSALTLTGRNHFENNGETGLALWSSGAVTVNNITSRNNGLGGVYIDNCMYDAGSCLNPRANAVKLLGYVDASENAWHGLRVWSLGAISANNVRTSGNGGANDTGHGSWLFNAFNPGNTQGVTLTGYVDSNDNYASGLEIHSYGAVVTNNLVANNNGRGAVDDNDKYGYGVKIVNYHFDTARAVTVTLNGSNQFNSNWSGGLYIDSSGLVKTNNLSASWNEAGYGAAINNAPFALPANIALTGNNTFHGNGFSGLFVISLGEIAASHLWATGNGFGGTEGWEQMGAHLENCGFDYGIQDCTGSQAPRPVKLTGTNRFADNALTGLRVFSYGAISANAVSSSGNGGSGVVLYNKFAGSSFGAAGAVTLTGKNSFTGNASNGLNVFSFGRVTLNNILASNNGVAGAYVNSVRKNLTAAAAANFVLAGVNVFDGNAAQGLYVDSDSFISLTNVSANGNTGTGVYLDQYNPWDALGNPYGLVPLPGFAFNGANTFSNNGGVGLYFLAIGDVLLNRITADGNSTGISGITGSNLTINCGSMTNNTNEGLWLTFGPASTITLRGVYALMNGGVPVLDGLGTVVNARGCG